MLGQLPGRQGTKRGLHQDDVNENTWIVYSFFCYSSLLGRMTFVCCYLKLKDDITISILLNLFFKKEISKNLSCTNELVHYFMLPISCHLLGYFKVRCFIMNLMVVPFYGRIKIL